MKEIKYEGILMAKEHCYDIIKQENPEFLKIFKYYKGDLLPLINTKCRKNMTCGDIDCIQWDFSKKILRIIECKRSNEINKDSQNKLLNFLADIKIIGYRVEVYKIIGNPPFNSAEIIDIKNNTKKTVDNKTLIKFLNLD